MQRIKQLRLKNGATQAELAKFLKVAQNTLSYWEAGKYEPPIESLNKLADYFHVSIDYLLEKTDDPTPKHKKNEDATELTIDTLEYALYGTARELDDDEKEELLRLAKHMRKKRREAQEKGLFPPDK